jgi:hypothetical protein
MVALSATPNDDPVSWTAAEALGAQATAVVYVPPRQAAEEVDGRLAALAHGVARLVGTGVEVLAHVSLLYGTRPAAEVAGEIACWSALPISGVFLDHSPAGEYHISAAVAAIRAARRWGLDRVVLNAGVPVDPAYRRLAATICTFMGPWPAYLEWSGEGSQPGDAHLVFAVPAQHWGTARALMAVRQAGLTLVTDRTTAYASAEPVLATVR